MILTLADSELLKKYNKCSGISLINRYIPELSVIKNMFVLESVEEWFQVQHSFGNMVTIRMDNLIGEDIPLIAGRTTLKCHIPDYISMVADNYTGAVCVCLNVEDGSNQRIYTEGGLNIIFDLNSHVLIEYVGPGFDCRELTKGKSVHEGWNIPIEEVPFIRDTNIYKYCFHKTSQQAYLDSLEERMSFLKNEYPQQIDIINSAMDKVYHGINRELLRRIIDDVLYKIWFQKNQLQ